MSSPLSLRDRVAYRAQQYSFLFNATVLQETARLLARIPRPELGGAVVSILRRRTEELYRRDLQNVADGLYPRALLFGIPVAEYARALPQLIAEHGVQLRQVPEEIELAIGNAAGELMSELRENEDELVARIVESFLAYRTSMVNYMQYADGGVMNARLLDYTYPS